MINVLFLATAMAAAPAARPAPAAPAKPATPPAASSALNMVAPFIGACINPGPDPKKIREAIIKAGGQSAPEQPGKSNNDPSRLSGYRFQNPRPYSVIFNAAGTCTVVARDPDIEKTKSSLAQFVAGSTAAFDINMRTPPAKPGETVLSAYLLTSKKGGPGMLISLSNVTRDGATATFLSRRVINPKP